MYLLLFTGQGGRPSHLLPCSPWVGLSRTDTVHCDHGYSRREGSECACDVEVFWEIKRRIEVGEEHLKMMK